MMTTIALVVIFLSLCLLFVLCLRAIPRLRVIDVQSIQKEKVKAMKEEIIFQKLTRKSSGAFSKVSKGSTTAVRVASKYGRRAVQRLYALEQYYQKLTRMAEEGQHTYDKERVRKLVDEAEELMKQDELIPAEKIFIDIISHNPKALMRTKGSEISTEKQAIRSSPRDFLSLKLAPNDASVHAALGEIELMLENPGKALEHLQSP
jgi:hypothetical protein